MSNSRFNLKEYLNRIGLNDYLPEPNLDCLTKISFHHLMTFPYENSRLYKEGKKPAEQRQLASLDEGDLYDEIVNKKMPAYCFQHMSLLRAALTRVGFDVTAHLSKVILEPYDKIDYVKIAKRPTSHVAMIVTINKQSFLVDSGFSNESLRQPLPLMKGKHALKPDHYLLEEFNDHWCLNSERYDCHGTPYWFGLFRFDKQVASEAEISKAHHDIYFMDNIPIRTDLLLFSKVSERKRKFVCWVDPEKSGTFKSINSDGSVRDTKTFTSEEEATEFAKKKFSL
jgi:arylamine N-acetyltransferase